MSGQNQHEALLNTINETQKTLDEIFVFMDNKEDMSQLSLDSFLFDLNYAKLFVDSIKNNLSE